MNPVIFLIASLITIVLSLIMFYASVRAVLSLLPQSMAEASVATVLILCTLISIFIAYAYFAFKGED
jgi:hypothetical protein